MTHRYTTSRPCFSCPSVTVGPPVSWLSNPPTRRSFIITLEKGNQKKNYSINRKSPFPSLCLEVFSFAREKSRECKTKTNIRLESCLSLCLVLLRHEKNIFFLKWFWKFFTVPLQITSDNVILSVATLSFSATWVEWSSVSVLLNSELPSIVRSRPPAILPSTDHTNPVDTND